MQHTVLVGIFLVTVGITCPGDMAKAFGAGADFVMAGGIFAGHDENPGELVEDEDGNKFKNVLWYELQIRNGKTLWTNE